MGHKKAFGAPYASNDWILSIDADERLRFKCYRRDKKLDLEKQFL